MRPYALIRAAVILAFLAWVGLNVVPLLLPPRHVRQTDASQAGVSLQQVNPSPAVKPPPQPANGTRATDLGGLPPQQVEPQPALGASPPPPPLTEAQVSALLRQHGYVDVSSLVRQPGGDWLATASRAGNGTRLRLRIDRDGRIATE